jgi:hypothetical protein
MRTEMARLDSKNTAISREKFADYSDAIRLEPDVVVLSIAEVTPAGQACPQLSLLKTNMVVVAPVPSSSSAKSAGFIWG